MPVFAIFVHAKQKIERKLTLTSTALTRKKFEDATSNPDPRRHMAATLTALRSHEKEYRRASLGFDIAVKANIAVFGSLEMAGAAGFEPATYGFGDRRSTN